LDEINGSGSFPAFPDYRIETKTPKTGEDAFEEIKIMQATGNGKIELLQGDCGK
jgi:hypothetical protein